VHFLLGIGSIATNLWARSREEGSPFRRVTEPGDKKKIRCMQSGRSVAGTGASGFWKGRRVLVTGHTGFKGAWLSMMLARMGATVCGLALAPATDPNLFDLLDLSLDVDSIEGDIRDEALVRDCIERVKPEFIFHLAAQALVRVGYERPVHTYATNVLGTAHVLDAARQAGIVRGVVVVTSDKCYRNREWLWPYREDEALGGRDPYSSSKAAAELVAEAYAASYASTDLRIATARAGNVIGGGDWSPDRLVPDIVRAVGKTEPLVLRYPKAVRPWQHVLDPLAGYLTLGALLHSAGIAGAWNFGPSDGEHLNVEDVATSMFTALGKPANIRIDRGTNPHEAAQLRLDSTKARELLGWQPKLGIREAISWTARWHSRVSAGQPPRDVTIAQIDEYFEK
jgi:CDP-glucose 4,6-dehydratase